MAIQTVGGPVSKEGMSRLTTEYVYFPITTSNNLDGVTAFVAFLTSESVKPETNDWSPAEIVDLPFTEPVTPAVKVLVGPELTGVDLTPSSSSPETYFCWIKLETGSEVIVRRAGTLSIR